MRLLTLERLRIILVLAIWPVIICTKARIRIKALIDLKLIKLHWLIRRKHLLRIIVVAVARVVIVHNHLILVRIRVLMILEALHWRLLVKLEVVRLVGLIPPLLILLLRILFVHVIRSDLEIVKVLENVWWMTLAYHVQRLFEVMEHNLSRLLKACHLYFDYVSNALFVILYILNAFVVLNHSGDTQIQTAKHYPLLYILNKGQNIGIFLESAHINNISIDKPIANALSAIAQDLMI